MRQAGGGQGAAVAGQARPGQQELVVYGALPWKETEVRESVVEVGAWRVGGGKGGGHSGPAIS